LARRFALTMVRLKDIAARAGVSVMTVSKAMRDVPDIAATTKARVKLLAQQMGYVPDTFAQVLRTRASKLYGLVISSITNPIFARIVLAIEERAHRLGYDVILAQTRGTVEREEACIRRLLARRVEGLFIFPVYRLPAESPIYRELQSHGVPTVILGHRAAFCSQFASVEPDDLLGSFQLTRHLLQLGHRRIAYFAGPIVSPAAQERFEGFRRALREVELDVDDKLVFQAGSTIEDGAKAAKQFISESTNATAVLADNDLVAIGAGDTFLNQGLKIPQNLSLAGFGNILVAEYFRVPLTTVRQPKQRLGLAAMDVMLQLQQGQRVEPKRLPSEVIVRASTAPPPAKQQHDKKSPAP
jgi:DNA-binding LacI/PurR family transcriptional regulator